MRRLSISQAWDETRAILSRDGRLIVSVALALIVLPSLITALVTPRGLIGGGTPPWALAISIIAYIVTVAGQLGIIRLALGPSITVGGAIAHGIRRVPIYILAAILIVAVLFIVAIPFALALQAMGVPLNARGGTAPANPTTVVFSLLYLAIVCFIFVRMIMSAPVASAELRGPIGLLRRSWDLTAGSFWRLLGFLLLFFVMAAVVLMGVGTAIGVVTALALGPIQPLSLSALVVGLIQALLSAALTTCLGVMLARIYVQLSGSAEADSGVPITGS